MAILSSGGMKKNVLPSKIRSLSGTNLIGNSLRFLFLSRGLASMASIPLLLVMTRFGVKPMFGVDALRSGAGVEEDVGGVPAEKASSASAVDISYRSFDGLRVKRGVSRTTLVLNVGVEVVRCIAGMFLRTFEGWLLLAENDGEETENDVDGALVVCCKISRALFVSSSSSELSFSAYS